MTLAVIYGKDGTGKTTLTTSYGRDHLKIGGIFACNYKIFPQNMGLKKAWKFREKIITNADGSKEKVLLSDIEGLISDNEDYNNPEIRVHYWYHYRDWLRFKPGTLVGCDEGMNYFHSHNWAKLPRRMRMKLTQHRKDKINVLFNFPAYTDVDKTIRSWCRKWLYMDLRIGSPELKNSIWPRISKIYDYDLETLNRCENMGINPFKITKEMAEKWQIEPNATEWFWISKKKMSWYDSSIKVGESLPEPLEHEERVCEFKYPNGESCGKVVTSHF